MIVRVLKKVFRNVNETETVKLQEPILFTIDHHDSAPQASHSGNIGDIIFSCLFLKAYWEKTGIKVNLHLQTNVSCFYQVEHPLKNIYMNDKMAQQLYPLLVSQPYIDQVTIGDHLPENITLPLNNFRQLPFNLTCGLIQGWTQFCTDLWLDIFQPWIQAEVLSEYASKIVISRTSRLRSPYIRYDFLYDYKDRLLFIGLDEEYQRFVKETGIKCSSIQAENFIQLANIINSCFLFIGNQGFPYTVAESVKCPRLLESNNIAPNNYPMSPNGRIALFQEQFEAFTKEMINRTSSCHE
jgi:hypothetical protein